MTHSNLQIHYKSIFKSIRSNKTKQLYFLIGSMLIISYDTYWFGTSGIKIFEVLRNLFAVCLPIGIYVKYPHTKFTMLGSMLLFLLVSVISLSSLFNENSISAPLLIFSGIFVGFYLVTKYSFYSVAKCFANIIIVISFYSFIVWIGCATGHITMSETTNIADNSVFTAFGCVFFSSVGDVFLRNSAIFREPGVYMIVLNFAIMFELFVLKDKHMWTRVVILITAMISLFSTGGFICVALTLVTYSIRSPRGIMIIILLSALLSMIIIPTIDDEILELVFYNKFDEMETSGSGFARMSSFFIPLEIFLDYPLLGCGFKQFEVEYVKEAFILYGRYVDPHGMSSNTIMNIFAIWGAVFGVFVVYGFFKLSRLISYHKSILIALLLCTDLFMMFSNENMPYWPFMYIFLLYGITTKNPNSTSIKNYESEYSYLVPRV